MQIFWGQTVQAKETASANILKRIIFDFFKEKQGYLGIWESDP